MAGKQAKTLDAAVERKLLVRSGEGALSPRDEVIVLLSFKAGLRACEIARLEWSMVLDASGQVSRTIQVEDGIAKMGRGRSIPMHADLRKALVRLKPEENACGAIIRSRRGGALRPNSIVNWFKTFFCALDLEGCSSHSGRRTFITNLARSLPKVGGSLREVQTLAGHRSIETTQLYVEFDTELQRKLINSI